MDENKLLKLKLHAANIRKMILTAVYSAALGHPGGSLSAADILTYLYMEKLNINPNFLKDPDRDRFVLSKGHCSPALYAALAERGLIDKSLISSFRHLNSPLQGHPDMKSIKSIDMSSGSLGQGLGAACGMALCGKIDKKSYRTYVMMGDGESEEGEIWESAMFAAHYKLDNLTVFLDYNGLQIDGPVTKVMNPTPLDKKFAAFNWHVISINAHDFNEIEAAVCEAETVKEKPTLILAKSIKGKGVSFMENQVGWHGKAPNKEQYELAISEINEYIKNLK